jgi:hypothetical protein
MKITEATPAQKIRALAELDGWILAGDFFNRDSRFYRMAYSRPNIEWVIFSADYLTSYDAILPLIQKQPVSIQMALDLHMRIEGVAFWTVATPTQLANALLVATGKFEV